MYSNNVFELFFIQGILHHPHDFRISSKQKRLLWKEHCGLLRLKDTAEVKTIWRLMWKFELQTVLKTAACQEIRLVSDLGRCGNWKEIKQRTSETKDNISTVEFSCKNLRKKYNLRSAYSNWISKFPKSLF